MAALMNVTVYTDGACSGNPGPGGYGCILQYVDTKGKLHERCYSEAFPETTNNRMELLSAIVALEKLVKPCRVTLYSDSQYLCRAFSEHWIDGWKKVDFRRGKSGEVKNLDLWERLLSAMAPHEVEYVWVRGHDGNEGNERCDKMAVAAYKKLIKETEKSSIPTAQEQGNAGNT